MTGVTYLEIHNSYLCTNGNLYIIYHLINELVGVQTAKAYNSIMIFHLHDCMIYTNILFLEHFEGF